MSEGAHQLAAHLQALEERLLDPEVRSSPQAVADLLTAGFREFGSSGRSYTRDEVLAVLAAEAPAPLIVTDLRVEQLAPSLALVTYRSHRGADAGSRSSALRSSVWRLEADGHWRMHFHQGTRLP